MMNEKITASKLLKSVFENLIAAAVSIVSFVLAFLIRFEFNVNTPVFDVWFSAYANHVIQLGLLAFASFLLVSAVYEIGKVRFGGQLVQILISTLIVEIATYIYMTGQIQKISRSIYIISFLLMFFLLLQGNLCMHFILRQLSKIKLRRKESALGDIQNEEYKPGYLESLDKLQFATVKSKIEGRNVLISGAGGSYGRELAGLLADFRVRRLILVDTDAQALFELYEHLKAKDEELKLEVYVCDVRRVGVMSRIFEKYRPHIVFHAAAYKKYIKNKENRREFISNNLLGTKRMTDLAIKNLAECFVLVSEQIEEEPFVMRINKRREDRAKMAGKNSGTQVEIFQFKVKDGKAEEMHDMAENTFGIFARNKSNIAG